MDRGGNRIKLFNALLDRKLRFIVRCVGDRDLHFGSKVKSARELGTDGPVLFADTVIKKGLETEKSPTLQHGFRPVKLPGRSK